MHGREVDFVVLEGPRRPILAVECTLDDAEVGKGLRYFKGLFPNCPAWQVTAAGRRDYETPEGIRVGPALRLLGGLV